MGPSTAGEQHGERGDQAEVIAFLSDPQSFPAKPHRIERFETHGALVFLAGEEAWKIKRAVRFPYMDFSTLEKRQAVCAREVEINRRLAPELYLGCVPVTRASDGGLQLGGDGEVIEWAVRMRRFDQAALLSRSADAGPLPSDLAKDLADAIYESHRTAAPAAPADGAARCERLIASIGATLAEVADAFDPSALQHYSTRVAERMQHAAAVLDARAAAGYVRRCHGDLHLNNIVLWHGRPVLFDAIEFDDDLATVDTLYDLAFLLMDLDNRGQRTTANAVLNRYLWRSGSELDLQGLQVLPLFLGLRSVVRAMVTAQRAAQQRGEARERSRQEAGRYLDAAVGYLSPGAPRLIAVGGLSGAGKSTLARALAPDIGPSPGAVHLRSDLERKALYGVDETTRLPDEAYSSAAGDAVYANLYRKAHLVLAAGHACVVDAVFANAHEREAIAAVAADLRVPFQGLWLEAPAERLMDRVAARSGDASDATPDVVRQQLGRETGGFTDAWVRIDASASAPETLQRARAVLVT